jgi:DNA-binding LacI/PurR family transcriptional regulator
VEGARHGTEHLLAGGHTRVGFVGGPDGVETADERLAGYDQAMSAAGLPALVANGDFRFEGGVRATGELLGRGATAVLVANNLMALGVLHAIKEARVRVGEDVALVSIDDLPWAELTEPPLTTLAQPVRAMADAAVQMLLSRLEGRRKGRKCQTFDFELRHRSSCCAAKGLSPLKPSWATTK